MQCIVKDNDKVVAWGWFVEGGGEVGRPGWQSRREIKVAWSKVVVAEVEGRGQIQKLPGIPH